MTTSTVVVESGPVMTSIQVSASALTDLRTIRSVPFVAVLFLTLVYVLVPLIETGLASVMLLVLVL